MRIPMLALSIALAVTPRSALAQNKPLAEVLPDLILREIVLLPGMLGPAHVAHFSPLTNDPNNPAIGIVQSFNTQMATQFSTFPLGSSSGGMTYVFDDSVGTFRRGSASFGPSFAERAVTIGRRKLSAGFTYQYTSYRTFEQQRLDNGSIKFYLRHQDCCHFDDPANLTGFTTTPLNGTDRLNPPFKGDVIEAALSLEAATETTAAFANYGVTGRWDIGLAVPFVTVGLDARVRARIIRLVTAVAPDTHTFEYGKPDATQTMLHSGHATGVGDIVLRSKYHLVRAAGGGIAAALDLRLPTGDENNLLGAGGTQVKFLLVASDERGRFGRHVNLGYTAARGDVAGTVTGSGRAQLPDEINYTGGVEFIASPRLTLMGDVIGRTLVDAGRLDLVSKDFEYNNPPAVFDPTVGPGCGGLPGGFTCRAASFNEFAVKPGNLTLLLGTAGAKFNPVGNLLITGSVLFPITKAGLRSRVTAVVGVDYAF